MATEEAEAKSVGCWADIERRLGVLVSLSASYELEEKTKAKRLKAGITAFLDSIKDLKEDTHAGLSRAQLLCWKGRALGLPAAFNKEAEPVLSKAIKLEPSMIEAWNALGNCYWKKKDFKSAKNCFLSAIKQRPNAPSYRDVSMILRSIQTETTAQREANVASSVDYAKKAVALDMKDPESWYVLGNAYLTQFLAAGRDAHEVLQKALKAYSMSENFQGDKPNPDLYFNRANVYKFHEDYPKAIENYQRSVELDPSLNAKDEIEGIQRLVTKLARLVATKAGMKAKRLVSVCGGLPDPSEWNDSRELLVLSELQNGDNKGRAVVLKLVAPVNKTTDVPVSVVAIDRAKNMVVISLYNVISSALNLFKVGDTLVVMDPHKKQVVLGASTYPILMVLDPSEFLVNGKTLSVNQQARPQPVNQCV